METDKEIRADAKLKNLHPQALEDLWRFRNPEEGGEKLTLEAVAVQVEKLFGFSCSLSSLSEFYKWLRLKKRMDGAAERAAQARLRYAQENPAAALKELEDLAQFVFTAETFEDRDVLNWTRMKKLSQNDQAIKQRDALIAQQDRALAQKDELIEQGNRKINLVEQAAAEAKAKLQAITDHAKSNGGLTPETLKQIEEAAGLL